MDCSNCEDRGCSICDDTVERNFTGRYCPQCCLLEINCACRQPWQVSNDAEPCPGHGVAGCPCVNFQPDCPACLYPDDECDCGDDYEPDDDGSDEGLEPW